jgi:hypothetical protein
MNNIFEKFEKWRKTITGLILYSVLGISLGSLYVTAAIDTGSLVQYLVAILLLGVGTHDGVKLIKILWKRKNGKK